MSHIQFPDHVMFCNSTGNQTVNLIPAIQLGCRQIVLFSTPLAEGKGWTTRLEFIAEKYDIKCIVERVSKEEEKNLNILTDRLIQCAKEFSQVVWNISGGQKIPSASMLSAFQKRAAAGFNKDYVAYVEGSPPQIWYFSHDYQSKSERTSVPLSLHDLLHLSGFETIKDEDTLYPYPTKEVSQKIETGKKAFEYFRDSEIFREAFFGYMKPSVASIRTKQEVEDLLKNSLNSVKPAIGELRVTKEGYKNLEQQITKVFSQLNNSFSNKEALLRIIKPLKIIQKPSELYEDYWQSIKKSAIEQVLESIESDAVRLIATPLNNQQTQQLIEQIKSIGGQSEYTAGELYKKHISAFSSLKRNGYLFEWMVAAAIIEEIEKDKRLKDSVSQVYHSVKTKKIASKEKPDAEHDIVIVTKFGTLIIIELKTYEFSGDIAQAQEGLAYKKSGPYGSAMIIGPLFTSMVKINKNGSKEFPHYIEGPTKTQEDTAKQNDIEYYCLDKIPDMLRRKLLDKTME